MKRKRQTALVLLLAVLVCCLAWRRPGRESASDAPARRTRPAAGDTVIPQVTIPQPWTAGGSSLAGVRLSVWGAGGDDELRPEEVPDGADPVAAVVFFADEREIARIDKLPFERDC